MKGKFMKKLMLGNEAIARGAFEAGAVLGTAYPGTPSTEITEYLSKYEEVKTQWSTNEKVALEVAYGGSLAGGRALCCMKHVGLNVAADPLFTAAYTGVNGGLVIVVADDPGMHSSQNEQDSRFYARSAHVPMLEPADSQEAKEFTKLAFELSEKFDTPVLLRTQTRVSHSQSIVETADRQEITLKPYEKNMGKYVMMPAMAIKRHIEVEKRMDELNQYAKTLDINTIEYADKSIGVVCAGTVYNYVKEALPNASVLKLGMVYPIPKEMFAEFAKNVDTLYICEELEPFFENQIKAMGIQVIGKEIFSLQGEYSVNKIKKAILGETVSSIQPLDLPNRPPVMCPGCPHRGLYYVTNKLKLTAMGDIGCYTLGALPPLSGIDACLCMGASVGMALGMERVLGKEKKVVGVIGDSTFLHSGITGLIDLVYNGQYGTLLILDNSTTGMTGHQHHAGTGKNAKGEPTNAIKLEEICHACGVKHVEVVDPFDLKKLEKVLKAETEREAVSVVIVRRPCVLLEKQTAKPYKINDKCKKCKVCIKLGCPAISVSGDCVAIDGSVCNGCGLCEKVCAFGAIEGE